MDLASRDDRVRVNEVRKEYFKDNRPASTLIEVKRFAIEGMLIEIEAIAVVKRRGEARGGAREGRTWQDDRARRTRAKRTAGR